jgi:septal ring factor EnvC (AmiA/AmiB activator)
LSDEPNHALDQPLVLTQRRSKVSGVLTFVALAVIACALAFLWFNYGDMVRSALFPALSANPTVANGEETVAQKDIEALKRQTADSLQAMTNDLDAQKEALKSLSDQVAALVARIDALQSANSSIPAQTATVPAQPAVAPRPAVVAARKKPTPAAKPPGRISVGGAPLPPGPEQDR